MTARTFVAVLGFFVLVSALPAWTQKDSVKISRAIASLGSENPETRWEAVTKLIGWGHAPIPYLLRALESQNEQTRAYAALTFGRIGPTAEQAVPYLTRLLSDSSPSVREKSAEALGAMGRRAAPATEALLLRLEDKDPFVSGKSAEALSKIGTAALPGLLNTLRNGTPSARWSATIALVKMGSVAFSAVPALTQALADTDHLVRWGSVMALGNMGTRAKTALPALLGALYDQDEDVRKEASRVIDGLDPSVVGAFPDWRSVAAIIDTLTPRLMSEAHVPGAAIALIGNRSLVWSKSYGVTHAGSSEPVTGETMFEACSMSKPVFAFLAMMLVERGELSLDRPLVDYLDLASLRFQPGHERITTRMALAHTSGLPNWRKGEEENDGPLPVLFTPGSTFSYSGEGIFYLQKVVEQITSQPLDIYAHRMLFAPLGLEHISYTWEARFDDRIAWGHDADGRPLMKTRYTHPNAAYTLYVSAEDYARFLLAFLRPGSDPPHLLDQGSIDTMLVRQVAVASREPFERPGKARGTGVFWGLGWCINSTPEGDIVCHSGSNRSGFRCFCQFSPSRGSGLVIMTNGTGGTDLWSRLVSRLGNL
jgi:CubicO group peptidase (beta-lactamase class C family)